MHPPVTSEKDSQFDTAAREHLNMTAYYVFANPDKTKAGLRKLAEAVRKTYKIKV
jgi:hypothetical protein